jgi:aerobic carbon-monoxide dehydrogenase small subunit
MTDQMIIEFNVNGSPVTVEAEPRRMLADVLREDLGLTGTHLGCEHGVCGACTVLMDGVAVRSCLIFAPQAEGASVQTVEGLARDGQLHPLQEGFHKHHGLQCGFCTSGMMMAAAELLDRNGRPTEDEIREALSGNICRCTGYVNIVKAVRHASAIASSGDGMGGIPDGYGEKCEDDH